MHGLNFSYYLRHSGTVMHYFYFYFYLFVYFFFFFFFFFFGMSVVEGLDILPVGIVCIRVTQEY